MRVIKRRKGKKEYFYLQHSFREGNKVITKEKYLGKEIPKNLKDIEHELKKGFYDRLEHIRDNFQKEWKKYPESVRAEEKEQIAIAFTYNTNAIEGSTITLEDANDIIHNKIAPNKPLRDVKETELHAKVFLNMLDKEEKITNALFLRWHAEIFGETKPDIAGKYRDYRVRVGDYIAPDWQDIENMMGDLIKFISGSKINPVELSARAHYRFERIHPFGDGNGRIGRLLTNHILWHNKYPMLIIERKKRRAYYKALNGDEEGFLNYFFRKYLMAHKKRS